jgi:epoxyqueuosine reductase
MVSTAWVIEQGRALGFDRVGIAPVDDVPGLARFPEWLARGYAGEMRYLHDAKRRGARALWRDAVSVICCALNYDTNRPRSTETPPDPDRGWVSRYAWGDDYHTLLEAKLEALRRTIADELRKNENGSGSVTGTTPPDTGHRTPVTSFHCKLYVDTGPILERAYAARAGLGWQGKNTCLLDPELGSFFFLGLLVTNLELEPTAPQADGCGACTLCLDACPTNALVEPYLLDARRCISYLTIELRGPIPEDLRAPMGRHVFGCDICQDVCPYNRRSFVSDLAVFQPRALAAPDPPLLKSGISDLKSAQTATETKIEARNLKLDAKPADRQLPVTSYQSLFHPSLSWLASLSEADFREIFKNSAIKRAKYRGLLRNTLVAIGNSRNPRFRGLLERFAASPDELLAEHARWALAQLPTA